MADVIDIGDWKLHIKGRHRMGAPGECDHKHIELDERGDIVRCSKCGVQLSAFWALEMLADEYNRALSRLQAERATLAKAKESEICLLAAKKVEKAWRSRTMVPACPHCGNGILPQDGLGNASVNREIELRKRQAAGSKNKASGKDV